MVVRHATPEDSRAIDTIHASAWQAAYQGVVPAQFLDSMSVDQREGVWRQKLELHPPPPLNLLDSLTIQKKGEIHESHNIAYNDSLWTDIETIHWVLAQIITLLRQSPSA